MLIHATCSSHICVPYHRRRRLTFAHFEIRCVKSSVSSNKPPLKEIINPPLIRSKTPTQPSVTISMALAFHSTLTLAFLNLRCKWGITWESRRAYDENSCISQGLTAEKNCRKSGLSVYDHKTPFKLKLWNHFFSITEHLRSTHFHLNT